MTTCELVTYDAEDQLDLQIDSVNLCVAVIKTTCMEFIPLPQKTPLHIEGNYEYEDPLHALNPREIFCLSPHGLEMQSQS